MPACRNFQRTFGVVVKFTHFLGHSLHGVSDYIYVPLLRSLGFIVVGIMAILIVLKDFKIRFYLPLIKFALLYHLKEGGCTFLSRIAISFYTVSNIFILGLITNNIIVSYYSIVEKLINVLKRFCSIILQLMYPFVSRFTTNVEKEALVFVRREIKFSILIGITASVLMVCFSKPSILFFFGEKFKSSTPIFQLLSITPVIILLSAIIGQQVLLNFGLKKLFTLSILFPSIIHIPLLFFLVKNLGAIGAAIAVVFTESSILVLRLFFLQRKRKDIFKTIVWR